MSLSEHQILDVTDHPVADRQGPATELAEMVQIQGPMSKFTDSSEPLFMMYRKLIEYDTNLIQGKLKGVDNVVIFMALFSAVVATLLTVTVPDLKRDAQDTSAFYLMNIYQLQVLSDSNRSLPSTPAQPPQFSAPKYAIWVNVLLFMSLCLNIFVALIALWIQGRVPRYLSYLESAQLSPHHRARTYGILATEFSDSQAFIPLVLMLWLSPAFFFSGLSIYLFNINRAVFGPVLSCICLCFFASFLILHWLHKVPSRSRSVSSAEIDGRFLDRLLKVLVEDSDLVQFFERIPGFCKSSIVVDPLRCVRNLGPKRLRLAVEGLLKRTWSSNFVSDLEKMRRLVACVNFADVARLPDVASSILEDIFPRDLHNVLRSVELGQFLRNQANRGQQKIGLCAQCIVAGIISNVQASNERWVSLAADQLGKSEDVIQGYLECGNDDNVLLANLTHITREILYSLKHNRKMVTSSAPILRLFSNFDVQNTLPELQDSFLDLWNEIKHARRDAPKNKVLKKIRMNLLNLYKALLRIRGAHDVRRTLSDASAVPPQDTDHSVTRSSVAPSLTFSSSDLISSVHDASAVPSQDTDDYVTSSSVSTSFVAPSHTFSFSSSDLVPSVHEEVEENAQMDAITGTSLPVSHHGASSSISPPRFNFPASGDITADAADELSSGTPGAARRPSTASRPTPALVSYGHSAITSAAAATATTGNVAREQPVRPDSSSMLPAMVTYTPSSTTPEVASDFRLHVADAASLISHHDAQDLGGPIEMTSLYRTRQSDTSAQNLDPSDNPI